MTGHGNEFEWRGPLTPWRVVQQRFFPQGLDVVAFSEKYRLDEGKVRSVFGEIDLILGPELCDALSQETGMTKQFFINLSDRYQQLAA